LSKGTPSSLTRPTFFTSVGHFICDLVFVDERLFLTVMQLVLPLHETATESVIEPLHAAVDPATASAAPTKTSSLCVWV
jgi:hypothetical protein